VFGQQFVDRRATGAGACSGSTAEDAFAIDSSVAWSGTARISTVGTTPATAAISVRSSSLISCARSGEPTMTSRTATFSDSTEIAVRTAVSPGATASIARSTSPCTRTFHATSLSAVRSGKYTAASSVAGSRNRSIPP
jgi:hypothetical protein